MLSEDSVQLSNARRTMRRSSRYPLSEQQFAANLLSFFGTEPKAQPSCCQSVNFYPDESKWTNDTNNSRTVGIWFSLILAMNEPSVLNSMLVLFSPCSPVWTANKGSNVNGMSSANSSGTRWSNGYVQASSTLLGDRLSSPSNA